MTGSTPRIGRLHDASKRLGITRGVLAECLISQTVKLARLHVPLELLIPHRPVIFREPVTEFSQLIRAQLLNGLLDLFDSTHRTPVCHNLPTYRPYPQQLDEKGEQGLSVRSLVHEE